MCGALWKLHGGRSWKPVGQVWFFPDAGHSPLVEKPAEFNRAVLPFLKNMEM